MVENRGLARRFGEVEVEASVSTQVIGRPADRRQQPGARRRQALGPSASSSEHARDGARGQVEDARRKDAEIQQPATDSHRAAQRGARRPRQGRAPPAPPSSVHHDDDAE